MLYLKLAWRNIWRNRRRTFITMASIIMAVLLATVMNSMQVGSYEQMIDNTVGTFAGHIQVQQRGYMDEPTLDYSYELADVPLEAVRGMPGIRGVIPRLDSYALAAGDERTRAVMVVGIDPVQEQFLSKPNEKIVKGDYFPDDGGMSVLITSGLADFLNVSVGDSLVLIGQGFRGMSASGVFAITGVMRFPIPEMNSALVYMPLSVAWEFFGAYDRVTAVAVLADRPGDLAIHVQAITAILPEHLVVLDWRTLMPELVQAIQADYGTGIIMMLILYMVVGFGILGTVLMMAAERSYEFGVMISIGTSRLRLSLVLIMEMFFISVIGALSGILASIPVAWYYNRNPLHFSGDMADTMLEYGMEPFIRFSLDPSIFIIQAGIVLAMALLISVYPLWHMFRLHPVKAMRS